MRYIDVPEVEMLKVSRSANNQRKVLRNFVPKTGLTIVDYARLGEIDDFYMDCQRFRDYYRDPYAKLQRPEAFMHHYGKCGNRCGDKVTRSLSRPITWVREFRPVTYPVEYDRNLYLNQGYDFSGIYDPYPCIRYKR